MIAQALSSFEATFGVECVLDEWAGLPAFDRGALLVIAAVVIMRRAIASEQDLSMFSLGWVGLGLFAYAAVLIVGFIA